MNFCQDPYPILAIPLRQFFFDVVRLQIEKYSIPVRSGTVAKGWHDAVCLCGVTSIRHKWLSPYGLKNYINNSKLEEKK